MIIKKLWRFGKQRHKTMLSALALAFVRNSLGICQLVGVLLAVQVLLGQRTARSGIWGIAAMMGLCVLGGFVCSYFEQLQTISSGMYMTADQRTAVAKRLRKMPLGFFRRATAEGIISTLTTTLSGVEVAATMSMVGIVSGFFSSAAVFLFLLWFDDRIGLLMGLGILCYLLVVRWQMVVSRKDAPRRQAAQTGLSGTALTFLQGIPVIKAFCVQKGDRHFQKSIEESCDANIALTNRSMPSQFAAKLVIAIFEGLILFLTLYFAFVTKELTQTETIVMLIFDFFAYGALDQAGSILSMVGMLESGLSELEEIQKAEILPQGPKELPKSEEIRVEDVCFSYGDHEVLHHVSAVIHPHTLTAIIGPSGSGKTTFCRLLARFQDVSSGKITIGGADVRNIPYETLMENISMVFQNVYLFEDTILNNIRFGKPNATLEEVRKAAKAARCDEFIQALPEGYDTMVQEGGKNLSGGEKQRISIARAILKDSPIILLDEATSALDAENERAFFEAIDELTQNKTVLMIAHRLSTVQHADRILAISDGRIVQNGTPQQLSQVPGLYADFLHSRRTAAGWTLS